MEKKVIKNWTKLFSMLALGSIALIMLMAEPAENVSFAKWMGVFIASKAAAIVCGVVAYKFAEDLTKEIKEA